MNLVAADVRRRALPYWESQEPFLLRGEGPDINGVDPRFARSLAEHESAMVITPLLQAMHDRFPQAIEEEVELLDLDFASYVLEWHGRVPQWRDFYLGLDQDAHYAYLRTITSAPARVFVIGEQGLIHAVEEAGFIVVAAGPYPNPPQAGEGEAKPRVRASQIQAL